MPSTTGEQQISASKKIKGIFRAENLLLDHITELAPVRPAAAFFLRLLDS